MFRLVTVFAAAAVLVLADPKPVNIFRTDITPDEAQQYLNSPPFTDPQLSGRTAVLPLVRYDSPNFRAAEAGPTLGHYWKNGKEIDNTDDYLEEVYNAAQFHGQDGLGAYNYGYKAPESSKVENRVRSGDVTGSYVYKAGPGNDDLIKVRYWADSQGFHQEDNVPKFAPKPVEETAAVKEARLAHEKAWKEAADAANHPQEFQQKQQQALYQQWAKQGVDVGSLGQPQITQPNAQQYNQQPQQQQQYQYQSSQQYQQASSQQYQGAPRQYQVAASNQQYQYSQPPTQGPKDVIPAASNQQYQTAAPQYQASQYGQQHQGQENQEDDGSYDKAKYEDPEPTGPPRGFFYSFDYPVSIIVPKSEIQGGASNPGHPVDHDTVAVQGQHY